MVGTPSRIVGGHEAPVRNVRQSDGNVGVSQTRLGIRLRLPSFSWAIERSVQTFITILGLGSQFVQTSFQKPYLKAQESVNGESGGGWLFPSL